VKIVNHTGVLNDLASGATATFDVEFVGDGVPHRFDLQFVRAGTNVVLGSIPVVIGTPIPGDGYEFEDLEEGEIEDHSDFGSASVETLLGDTNHGGQVNIVDLKNVRNNFGESTPGVLGDTNGDDAVDIVDLNNVRNNCGASLGGSGAAATPTASTMAAPRRVSAASVSGRRLHDAALIQVVREGVHQDAVLTLTQLRTEWSLPSLKLRYRR
jgi:hypothetical protein